MSGLVVALALAATTLSQNLPSPTLQPTERTKPSTATILYTGKRNAFTISTIPGVWEIPQRAFAPNAEVSFLHRDGDVYALASSERTQLTAETWKRILLYQAREGGQSQPRVVSETKVTVNGKEMTRLTFTSSTKWGSPIKSCAQFYGGPSGYVQVMVWCSSNAFDEAKDDIEDFLDGLEITAKSTTNVAKHR
jgi:hypothetical protein